MEENQKVRLQKVLLPLLMCSVEQRYALFYGTKTGKKFISLVNFEGSLVDVFGRIVIQLDRFGGVGQFLEEFEKLPLPEWYKK